MTTSRVARRAALTALCLPALLTACGGPPPPARFASLSWDYLQPLKLNVATIEVDSSWTSRAGSRERGYLAPTPPVDALRRMADDRLIPAGNAGRAVFVIDDASIVQLRDTYQGSFAVHLGVFAADGTRRGTAAARVGRTHIIDDDSANGVRAELYDMVKQMMSDMNVEFQYQVQKSLHDDLQTTAPAAPGAGPVEQQELTSPTAIPPPAIAPAAVPPASAVPFSSPGPTKLVP